MDSGRRVYFIEKDGERVQGAGVAPVEGPKQFEPNINKVINDINRDAEDRLADYYMPDYRLGNIDLHKDPAKTFTGKRYMVYHDRFKGEKVVIPAVRTNPLGICFPLSEQEAIDQYLESGRYYGKFNAITTPQEEVDQYLYDLELDAQKWRLKNGFEEYQTSKENILPNKQAEKDAGPVTAEDILARLRSGNAGTSKTDGQAADIDHDKIMQDAHQELLYERDYNKQKEWYGDSDDNIFKALTLAGISGTSNFITGWERSLGSIGILGKKGAVDILNRQNDALQQVVAEERSEMGNAQRVIFDMTQSFAQNAPSMLASFAGGSGIFGSALIFASTYGNELYYAEKAGADKETAITYAFVDGLAQAFLEYLGYMPGVKSVTKGVANALTKNISNATLKFIGGFAARTLGEGVTEMIQTSIENGLRNTALGEQNDAGLFSEESLYAGFLGVLSAGLMDGTGTIANYTTVRKVGAEYVNHENGHSIDEAVKIGLSNPKNSDLYRTARNIEAKVKNDETVTAYEVGKLVTDSYAMASESQTPEVILARQIETLVMESAEKHGVDPALAEDVAVVACCFGRPIVFDTHENMQTTGADGKVHYESGRYDPNTGVITLNAMATGEELVNYVLKHELAHSVERTKLGGQLEQIVRSSMGAEFDAAVQAKLAEYQGKGKTLDEAGAKHEVVAHWIGQNLYQNGFAQAVISGDAKVGNVLLRALDQVRLALGGTQKSRTAANIAIVERLFMRALQQSPALDSTGAVQYSIETLPDGRRYVKADRQVIFGEDPSQWEQQIIDYVNDVVRGGHDMTIPTQEGDVLTINGRTAWKLGYRNDTSSGKIDDATYRLKGDAAGHIDELSQVSRLRDSKPNLKPNRRTPFGRDGFDYRYAYFLDKDGSYYRLTLSVGIDGDVKTVYNIGEIKKVPFPSTAQRPKVGTTPSDNTVTHGKTVVNTQYMQNGAENSQSSFEGSDDIAEAVALMERERSEGNIDNSSEMWDNQDRANAPGDFVNEYYDALTKAEWNIFYKRLVPYLNRLEGTPLAVVVNDKLIITERHSMNGGVSNDFIVVDMYQVRQSGESNQILWDLQQIINDGEINYDVNERASQNILRYVRNYGQGELLGRYDRASHRFDYGGSARADTGYRSGVYQNRGEGVAGRGVSLGNRPSDQTNYGILNTGNNIQPESPPSQDGTGFFYAQNDEQSSFEGSDEIARAVALMERERAQKATDPTEPTAPAMPQQTMAGEPAVEGQPSTVGNIPSPLDSERVQEGTVSQAQTVEELTAEIGDEAVYRRMYYAAQIDRPPETLEIDGRTVNTTAYMDELYVALPDDDLQLTAYLKEREAEKAAQIAERFARGETDAEWTEVDLQILTARSKLEWGELGDSGESGSKTRRFYEQRLKGKDVNKAHEEELLEVLAGRSETYNPIANAKTLDRAKERLRNAEYQMTLRKRILRYKPNDLFNAVDAAAAQLMINDARNDGDLELYADLVQGLSRKGTELGRAVQVLSMQRRMTPEGTLKAAQRTLRSQADKALYDGANEDLDIFAERVTEAIERAETAKSGRQTGEAAIEQTADEQVSTPLSREELTEALAQDIAGDNSPYITADEIRGILERAVENASDIPDQLKRVLKKKLGSDMGTLAQRIAKMHEAGHLNDVTMRNVLEETLGLPTLTTADVDTLTKLVNELNDAPDQSAQQLEAMENIYRFLGEKLITTGLDKLQSWRKFGMLFNLKTHLRNFGSNAVFAGVNRMDSVAATFLERVFLQAENERTAAFGWSLTEQGRQLKPAIEKSTEQALLRMRGQGQKYEIANGVLNQYRKAFGTTKVGEVLNTWSQKNSNWLEWEDAVFFKNAYKDALGQIMVARGITEVNEDIENIAYKRAIDTVFRGENAITDVFSSIKRYQNSNKTGRKLFGHAVDIVVPFSKTPANIAYQSVEHSPIGLVKSAYDLVQKTRGKSNKTGAEIINGFSKGITGTVLFGIGLLLGKMGLFVTGFGKTEKERAADELAGIQENAFRFGDVTISLDWLQPAASPLIVGASIAQRLEEDGLSLGSLFGAVMDGTDSMFEMTMLQSLYDILGGYDAGASATVGSVAENLISQSIPTVLGQVARAVDPVQRKTGGESLLSPIIGTGDFAKLVNKVISRIPGLTYLLEPELDVWGNTVYRTGKASVASGILNAFQQFVLPANFKIATGDDEISRAVMELYNSDEAQPGRAIPTAITREKAAELGIRYEEANRLLGQNQYATLLSILQDQQKYTVTQETTRGGKTVKQKRQKYWSDMTDEERLQVLKKVYQTEKDNITDPDGEYYDEVVRRMN